MRISIKNLSALTLGIIVGLLCQSSPGFAQTWIKPFGLIFLSLLKMVIVPLVLAMLIVCAASAGNKKIGRISLKAILYYLLTTVFAVMLGLVLANLINPGSEVIIPANASFKKIEAYGMTEIILGIIPGNPIKALTEGNILQIIVFALFTGIAISQAGEKAKQMLQFFKEMAEVFNRIAAWIMKAVPFGIFTLIVPVVAANGLKTLEPLFLLIIVLYMGCILHAAIVYSASVKILGNMNPLVFFKELVPVMITAFSTCSSTATLPISIKTVEDKLGVSSDVAGLIMPLGSVLNTDGNVLYQGVCAVFIAKAYALDLSLGQHLTVVLTAALASLGTAGVPGAGLIMLSLVLQSLGLPLEGIALIAGIDSVLDMAKTTVNVVGDASAAVVIDYSERIKNTANRF